MGDPLDPLGELDVVDEGFGALRVAAANVACAASPRFG